MSEKYPGYLDPSPVIPVTEAPELSPNPKATHELEKGSDAPENMHSTESGEKPTNIRELVSKLINTKKLIVNGLDIIHVIETIRQGQYVEVDVEEYPTLESFLASSGEQGTVYLYPVDTTDATKGYYQYIWESTQWVSLGTTELDLTDYIKGTSLTAQQYEDLETKDPDMYYFIPEGE